MISPRSMYAAIAVAMAVIDQGQAIFAGFVVPDCTRAKIEGGKEDIAADSSSSSQGSVFQRISQKNLHQPRSRSPRMSEAAFRLDYIQGIRPSFNNNNNNKAPAIDPVEDEPETIRDDRDFAYGRDSTCYRGLTGPSKAGLVLAVVLASGMVVTSPEIHLSVPSLPFLLEGTRHLLGDETTSALGVLADRMAFDWDMSGLPQSFHRLSDQVAASLHDAKLVPFVAHQKDHLQEALSAVPSRLDALSVRIAAQTDAMKKEAIANTAFAKMALDRAVASGQSAVAQHAAGWQQASNAQLDRWHNDLVQASGDLRGGVSHGWSKGTELLKEQSAGVRHTGQAKFTRLQHDLLRDSGRLQTQTGELLERGKDAILWKASEFQEASRTSVDRIQNDAVQMNEQFRALATRYSTETKALSQQSYDTFREAGAAKMADVHQGLLSEAAKVRETMERVQQTSHSTMNEVATDVGRWTDNFRAVLANVGVDLGTKRNEIGSSIGPMVQDSTRFVGDTMVAVRDTTFAEWNKLQDRLALHDGDATMDAIGDNIRGFQENLQGLKESTTKQMSSLQASIGHREDTVATDSNFLKTLLDELVD
eukprot:jgi/Psemu1/321433/estExt_fgenesh1_pg.C_20047